MGWYKSIFLVDICSTMNFLERVPKSTHFQETPNNRHIRSSMNFPERVPKSAHFQETPNNRHTQGILLTFLGVVFPMFSEHKR